MEKISLKEYAELRGTSTQYLLKKICLQKQAGREPELLGVTAFEKFGKSWMLTIDKRILKKVS